MPKVVDNYILQQKIGAGQFGDVFKGYHQQTKQEVAIKTIRRQTIKGKFYELLQNEIKVLKTCDNANIIKLYAIKKTANHFYLMLEYCNQGDMLAAVRKNGTITQQKAIRYFCQILNAFQDLVKHKIMHRDFKLANILLHDGNIKIADFGFAKLLNSQDYATTMLGSPLNMAPEVLGGNKYNSKADIWSIGACLWEMLYGKPPYVASNMVDLLNNIKSKPLKFPNQPKINQMLIDVLKKMLVADPKRRISWTELFNHPINTFLANRLRKQINLQLIQDQSLVMNTSKFYLKKNLVIDNPNDIQENQKMNQYLLNVIKQGKKKQQFIIQKQTPKSTKTQNTQKTIASSGTQKTIKTQKNVKALDSPQISQKKPSQQNKEKKTQQTNVKVQKSQKQQQKLNKSSLQISFRNNMKKIMHYRNIYVFLATVSDQILAQNSLKQFSINYQQSQLIAYYIIHKILNTIKWLVSLIKQNKCPQQIQNIQNWQQFKVSKQLQQVLNYITKQYDVFIVFNQSIQPNIKRGIIDGIYDKQVKQLINNKFNEKDYKNYFKKYIKYIGKQITIKMLTIKKIQVFRNVLKHLEYCLIAYDTERVFGKKQFNFTQFYDSFNKGSIQECLLRIQRMIKQL